MLELFMKNIYYRQFTFLFKNSNYTLSIGNTILIFLFLTVKITESNHLNYPNVVNGGAKTRPFYSRDAFFPTEVKTSSNRAPIVCDKAPLMGSMRDHSTHIYIRTVSA